MLEKAGEWYEDIARKKRTMLLLGISYQVYTEMSYSVVQSFDIWSAIYINIAVIFYYYFLFTRIIWFQKLERVEEECTASVSFCYKQSHIEGQSHTQGVGVLLGILGGGVPPGSPNPDPISDQKMSYYNFIHPFKTWPLKMRTRFKSI